MTDFNKTERMSTLLGELSESERQLFNLMSREHDVKVSATASGYEITHPNGRVSQFLLDKHDVMHELLSTYKAKFGVSWNVESLKGVQPALPTHESAEEIPDIVTEIEVIDSDTSDEIEPPFPFDEPTETLDDVQENLLPDFGHIDPVETAQEIFKQEILIDRIKFDDTTQSRIREDEEAINEYTEALKRGDRLPDVTLFYDNSDYFIGDGWHRIKAHLKANKHIISCEIKTGTQRDAFLYSLQSNNRNGLRYTPADKRHYTTHILQDEEWSKFSNGVIAEMAGVSSAFVGNLRRDLGLDTNSERIDRTGRTIQTANIGRKTDDEASANLSLNSERFADAEPASPPSDFDSGKEKALSIGEAETEIQEQKSEIETSANTAENTTLKALKTGDVIALIELLHNTPNGILQANLIEKGFDLETINEAKVGGLLIRDEVGRCYYRWHSIDIREAIINRGPLTFIELEDLGCQSQAILIAKTDKLITQTEDGKLHIAYETDSEDEETDEAVSDTTVHIEEIPPAEVIEAEFLPPVEDNPAWDNAEIIIQIHLFAKEKGQRTVVYTIKEIKDSLPIIETGNESDLTILPPTIISLIDQKKRELKERIDAPKKTVNAKKPVSNARKSTSDAKKPVSNARKSISHATKPASDAKKPATKTATKKAKK